VIGAGLAVQVSIPRNTLQDTIDISSPRDTHVPSVEETLSDDLFVRRTVETWPLSDDVVACWAAN